MPTGRGEDLGGDYFPKKLKHFMRWAVGVFYSDIHVSFVKRWFVIFAFKRPNDARIVAWTIHI